MYLIKIYWMAWYEYILYDRNTTCVGRGFVDLAMALLIFLYNNVYICFFCGEDISIIISFECYFSLDRKVTKRSRLHLVRYSASCVRCRLWTRYAQTAQPPGAHSGRFALRSPDEAFHRTLCVLLRLPILPVKSESFCFISTSIGHPKRKHSFLDLLTTFPSREK